MKSKIIRLKNYFKWNLERILLKKEKKCLSSDFPKGKKMILVPHSDDEWIGCSKLLIDDNIIVNMDMSGDDKEEVHKIRYEELSRTSQKCSIIMYTLSNDKIINLKKIIDDEKPEYICVPYYIEWHREHIEVMNILRKTLNNKNIKIIMYQVSLPMYMYDITNYLPLTKIEWKNKWFYFRDNYKTQKNFPSQRFAINERINGECIGVYAAEVYSIVSYDKWIQHLDNDMLSKSQMDIAKNKLYSIKQIREYLNTINDKQK